MIKRIIDPIARFLIGGLFIFSGLIKLNDPIGTEIKMEEYFEVFATDFGSIFEVFIPYALEIAMIMIVLEIVLGIAVLINYKMRVTTVLILIIMIFFTFLTGYSAITNAVTDCGCFGDAIKLTPKQSFYKDLILMVFVLHLFWYRKSYQPVLRTLEGHMVIAVATILCFVIGIYALRHLPFIDFRAYKIGNNIPSQMEPSAQPIIEYVFEKDGKEVRSLKYLMPEEGYIYKNSYVTNEDETKAKITDYAVSDAEGEDVTQQTFEGAKLLFIIYNVKKASVKNMDKIKNLVKALDGKVEMMALTASSASDFESFRHEYQFAVPYYFVDATVLKTMVRSNPGITLWVDGTVKGMWHHNDTPDASEIHALISTSSK